MMHGKIKPGDVILSFNGQTITDPRDLARKAAWAPIGSDAELDDQPQRRPRSVVHVTMHEWPERSADCARLVIARSRWGWSWPRRAATRISRS